VLLSTLLLPFTLPLVWWVYTGAPLEMEVQTYLMRLLVYIFCPGLLALLYRKLALYMPALPGNEIFKIGAVVGLVVFAIAIMDGVTDRLIQEPTVVLGLVALGISLHFGLYGFAYWSSRHLAPRLRVESGLLSAFRNIGLIIAVSGPFLPAEFFLFAGVWQIPMYLSPWIFNRFIEI
jgi:BASS family bile acid:Na+ symporter